ncbi:MAG: energy transducer TonB [Bacteroidota bacterium]
MALKKNPKYDIKRTYYKALQLGIIFSLSLIILAFKFLPKIEIKLLEQVPPQEIMKGVELPPPIKYPEELPPPPKPPIPIESPTDELMDDETEFLSSEWDENKDADEVRPPIVEDDGVESEIEFIAVEKMPEPIGGIAGIQSKIVYPELAKRAGIQGKVFVQAFVDKFGKVYKVELLKGIGGGCDEAAIEAVSNTLFNPGRQRGKAVNVRVTIPVVFRLQ